MLFSIIFVFVRATCFGIQAKYILESRDIWPYLGSTDEGRTFTLFSGGSRNEAIEELRIMTSRVGLNLLARVFGHVWISCLTLLG